jgi:hypothetical protein
MIDKNNNNYTPRTKGAEDKETQRPLRKLNLKNKAPDTFLWILGAFTLSL